MIANWFAKCTAVCGETTLGKKKMRFSIIDALFALLLVGWSDGLVAKYGSCVKLLKPRICSSRYCVLRQTATVSNEVREQRMRLDKDFFAVGLPALVSLAAEPVSAIADAIVVAKLGTIAQAALGVAVNAQFSIAKLYNDPLLKTSTSLVAGKEGEELEASVASAIATAGAIGFIQAAVFMAFTPQILKLMGVSASSEMMVPALSYLRWRTLGVPAATLVLVTNGIFRGRGDTRTPLYCTLLGTLLNVALVSLCVFSLKMGLAGAGLATAIAQWCSVVPLLVLLNRKVPIRILGRDRSFFTTAVASYVNAGWLLLLRTVSKIAMYSFTSASAARLGPVQMAAYAVTFNIAMAGSQLVEALSIASQALIARNFPFNTAERRAAARHIIRRSVSLGVITTALLAGLTVVFQNQILGSLTRSADVARAAAMVMPMVAVTQVFKGLGYATGGIILGGLDWSWSSGSAQVAAVLCLATLLMLPSSLWNIWVALAVLMATQVSRGQSSIVQHSNPGSRHRYAVPKDVVRDAADIDVPVTHTCPILRLTSVWHILQVVVPVYRFTSNAGPWRGLDLLPFQQSPSFARGAPMDPKQVQQTGE